jgi:predicted ribosome quality control (RQC) complex YloA/Tae2 family protein
MKKADSFFIKGMAMDIFFIEAVVFELAEKLPGARVNKVFQPNQDDIILRLWTGRENLRLLVSASPRLCRIHLTTRTYPNPFSPPRFCQLLRSRLSEVSSVQQVHEERIVRIGFQGRDEKDYFLMAELLGLHANLILVDAEGKIVDALKRVEDAKSGRRILPGLSYQPPFAPSRHSLGNALPDVSKNCPSCNAFQKWLLANISPMSPLVAKDLAAGVERGLAPQEALASLRRTWLEKDFRPVVGTLEGKEFLSPFPLQTLALENPAYFPMPSAAADYFYYSLALQVGGIGDRAELEEAVRKAAKRLSARLEKIKKEQIKVKDFDSRRRMGDLLLANLHRLHRGMSEVVLEDFYSKPPAPITIKLDTMLTPQQNAEHYFKGFKKEKRGVAHIARRLDETLEEKRWLEEVSLALEEIEEPGELLAIRRELEEAGIVQVKSEPAGKKFQNDPKEQLRKAETPGRLVFYWGKNNRTNDYVSKYLTAPDDLWFHAYNMPGCHLVLKKGKDGEAIPEEDILFAASVAAAYSRGKNDGKVEVMVTEGKWVRKPKGSRPGLVAVEHYRTLVVRPFRPTVDLF